jgi:hypothetical protein
MILEKTTENHLISSWSLLIRESFAMWKEMYAMKMEIILLKLVEALKKFFHLTDTVIYIGDRQMMR